MLTVPAIAECGHEMPLPLPALCPGMKTPGRQPGIACRCRTSSPFTQFAHAYAATPRSHPPSAVPPCLPLQCAPCLVPQPLQRQSTLRGHLAACNSHNAGHSEGAGWAAANRRREVRGRQPGARTCAPGQQLLHPCGTGGVRKCFLGFLFWTAAACTLLWWCALPLGHRVPHRLLAPQRRCQWLVAF